MRYLLLPILFPLWIIYKILFYITTVVVHMNWKISNVIRAAGFTPRVHLLFTSVTKK